ncbi:MAG: 2-oxo acid dehydrogenase subunit E2 [Lachnospiraceae bacterium]|nr:2-oxo acid dehydrogenase subunit E2 [Lachnospiraceae bacterium]
MTEIKMPSAGQTTDEARIVSVNVKVGDTVKRGDVLVEAETDKAVLPVESFASGTVLAVLVQEDSPVTKGTVLVVLGKEGETFVPAAITEISAKKTPVAATTSEQPKAKAGAVPQNTLPAMPNAKKEARERGLSLADIPAANGIYIKQSDVTAFAEAATAEKIRSLPEQEEYLPIVRGSAPVRTEKAVEADDDEAPYRIMPMSRMRKIIGQRMLESSQTIPSWQCTVSVDMTNAIALRDAYKAQDVRLSFNDILIKAVAVASRRFPLVNARWEDGEIRIYSHTNVGLAVVTDDGNLVVPVARSIDTKNLSSIAAEYRELIKKARIGKLVPDEMGCGSITISNLGMFDVDQFVAIVNPPESSILAVGRIRKQPVWNGETFIPKDVMTVTGSFDHRMIDGAYGAQFLKELKALMENPVLFWVNTEVAHGTV